MQHNSTTTAAAFQALTERHPDIVGTYDQPTHSMTVFLAVKGVLDFTEWRKRSERIRRQATMTRSSVLDVWTVDRTKPKLVDRPTFAVTYDAKTGRFLPALNIAVVTVGDFGKAQAEAVNAASECNLWRERHGRLPGAGDLSQTVTVYYPGGTPGTDAGPEITDLLTRINGSGG